MANQVGNMAIGKVLKVNRLWKAAKVSVQRLKLDENTNVVGNFFDDVLIILAIHNQSKLFFKTIYRKNQYDS